MSCLSNLNFSNLLFQERKLTMLTVLFRSLQKFYKIANGDPGPLSTRDNQLLFAFWTCLQLERYL